MRFALDIAKILPEGWSVGERLPSGGQADVVVVRHADGREGVLRTLKEPVTTISRERFCREIGILCGRVEHRSVVRIHEWCLEGETPWYIGELGDSFEKWWRQWKKPRNGRTSEAIVRKAVWITRELASALGICHREGIVHRDIKPKNIVVKRGEGDPWPILIDFGVAHDESSSRLTPTADAVGNARFSPDVMRMRVEEVRPWLDVFELGQLMIWMLDADAPKAHWSRPVHWNHAKYPGDMCQDSLMLIRAFTSACSTESVAPRDGSECVELLNTLFAGEGERTSERVMVGMIARAKRQGAAKRLLVDQALAAEIEASAPLAETVYADLRRTLISVCEDISEEESSLSIDVDNEFHYQLVGATDLFWMRVGAGKANIQLRVKCKIVPWSEPGAPYKSNVEFWRKHLPDKAICFTFAVEGGVVAAGDIRYLQGRWLTILRDGGINLHALEAGFGAYSDNDLGGSAKDDGRHATMTDIREFAESVLTDEEYWTYMAALA